jgi:eukaryotic-like serine/threonine-protein kinase
MRTASSGNHDVPSEGATTESEPPLGAPQLELLEVRSDDRFVVQNEIGRGGMGVVSRVYDRALFREAAMKGTELDEPVTPGAIATLLKEAQITGQLEHPHIVPVHDVALSSNGSAVTFTMKLVRGSTFTSFVEALHRETWDDRAAEGALQVILKVCDALAFAHSRGVVHRDVKPDNVMVGNFGQVYLMDWGVALVRHTAPDGSGVASGPRVMIATHGGESEQHGTIAGTIEYMAPEQILGQTDAIDARTDVFGVGGLVHFVLTGFGPNYREPGDSTPLLSRSARHLEERAAWPGLPPELCRITLKALAPKREDRYQSIVELQREIGEFLRGGGWFATQRYAAGAVIIREGDVAHEAYIVVEGTCEVTKVVDGSPRVLRQLAPGDAFGETAILTGEVRTASVVAVTNVIVKVVTADAFEREFSRRSWAGVFVRALAARFRELDGRASGDRKNE